MKEVLMITGAIVWGMGLIGSLMFLYEKVLPLIKKDKEVK